MAKYDVVLLDADGTLFDFHKSERQAFDRTMQQYQLPNDDNTYHQYREINEALWRALEHGETTQASLKVKRFEDLLRYLGKEADCASLNTDYLEALGDGSFLIQGAEAVCGLLANHCKLYILTNGITHVQERRLEHSKIADCITKMFVSESLGLHKPEAAFFDAVFTDIGPVDKSRCLMVGDSIGSDMRGGKNAGVATCWYNPQRLPCPAPELCDFEISHLEELAGVVMGAFCPGFFGRANRM